MGKYTIAYSPLERMRQKKKMADLFKRKIVCEEKECNRYELLMEECLKIHKLVFHGNQNFERGHRPIENSCKKKKERIKFRSLIETNTQGELKYRDKKGNKYPDIESFRNRMSLSEIEIKETLKKRKGNILLPREEGRTIKVNIKTRATKQAMRRKIKEKKNTKRGKRNKMTRIVLML